jgi:S1-C subfamily serine protease
MMVHARSRGRAIRLVAVGLIIGLAAYWIGTRYGQHISPSVDAVPSLTPVSGPYKFDPTETENIRIYKAAAPAVANIVTRTVQYDFFYDPVPIEGAGSGFVIDALGHILTDYHVVEGAQTIEVTLGDSSRYKAKLIGEDKTNDIALLQVDPRGHKLTVLPLGDSRYLQVGQRVLAIGNPFGFESTLTTGIISSLGRTVQTEESFIDQAIQTDAAINRGNSGGPLLDSQGQVIGINSAIVSPSGANAGIGFAIPINTARRVAQQLIAHGRVLRATLGVEGLPIWPELADALQLGVQQGLLVQQVSPGSAAQEAGVRAGNRTVLAGLQEIRIGGDVIVGVNGTAVTNQTDLNLLLNRAQPGDTVALTIVRGGKKMNVPVKLGEGS